jgi:hypothetical protein
MNLKDEIHHELGDRGGEGASVAVGIVTGPPQHRCEQGSGGQCLLVTAFPIATPRLAHTANERSSNSFPFGGSQDLLPDWVCTVPGSVCLSFSFSSSILVCVVALWVRACNVALLLRLEDPP